MGPQDPKDVARDLARDLSGLAGELVALKGDAAHWLRKPEYAVLVLRLEDAARGGRGGADRGQEAGEDERGAGESRTQEGARRPWWRRTFGG